MPVKIVPGSTDPANGMISQHDLFRIIEDFQNFVMIDSGFERPAHKINNILIPINIIRELLKKSKETETDAGIKYININFGLTLPNQKSCSDDFQTDISNQLTVVINLATESKNVVVNNTNIDDFIITTGFKTYDKGLEDAPCCGKPGGGNG